MKLLKQNITADHVLCNSTRYNNYHLTRSNKN